MGQDHKDSDFKEGDLVLVYTNNLTNLAGPKKLQDSFVGPFPIRCMHGPNAAELILSGEIEKKHPTFPVSLLKHYKPSDKDKFPLRKEVVVNIPVLKDDSSPLEIKKILKDKIVRIKNKDTRLYLARYKGRTADSDKWLRADEIPDSDRLLRNYRSDKKK